MRGGDRLGLARQHESEPFWVVPGGLDPRAIAYGEERRIRFSRPVCSEQVSSSETLPILPGWNNPALELLICDCPALWACWSARGRRGADRATEGWHEWGDPVTTGSTLLTQRHRMPNSTLL